MNCKYNEKFNKYEPISKSDTNTMTDISVIKS